MNYKEFYNQELENPNTKYFVLDSNGIDFTEDEDFVKYVWEKRKFNKMNVGDLFIYRRPNRGSKNNKFYFFGTGKIVDIKDDDIFSTAKIGKTCSFSRFIYPEMLDGFRWTFKNKSRNDWKYFFNQYGMNLISKKDFTDLLNLLNYSEINLNHVDDQNYIFINPEEEELFEGTKKTIVSKSYERNPKAREKCLSYYGYDCAVCGINFNRVYGEIGSGFIEVHHVIPVSKRNKEYKINPIKDLIPLCPNCHSMIHRKNNNGEYYSVEELRKIFINNKQNSES